MLRFAKHMHHPRSGYMTLTPEELVSEVRDTHTVIPTTRTDLSTIN